MRQGEWFFIPEKVTKKTLPSVKIFGRDTDASKQFWQRETLKLQFVQDADGNLEEWNQTAFFEKFDKDYQETRERILNNLKG